jgi:sugar phosphate isomerase/epimerase
MDRRAFLGTMSAATFAPRRLAWASAERKIEKLGVQLYTVRSEMKKDFEGTIARVAEIGYREVEFAGYFERAPAAVRAVLSRNGLAAPAAHVDYKTLSPALWPQVLETSKAIGHRYLVMPWVDEELRKAPDAWKRIAETLNRAGLASQAAGIQLAYHNHWFEFIPADGQLPYDILLAECDANLVKMELDLCWIVVGGQDPLAYFERHPGRFPLVHVKDIKKLPKVDSSGKQNFGDSLHDMTDVGSGLIDWKRIFAQADKAGIRHYVVEHDNPEAPFDSIKASFAYLKRLRF